VDFRQFGDDLEAARAAGAEAVKKADAGPAAARAVAGALLLRSAPFLCSVHAACCGAAVQHA
jgi:hypothetical protein